MPSRFAGDREAVARAFLKHVREQNGEWVRGKDAFEAAIGLEECCNLEWVRYIQKNPKARAAITRVIAQLIEQHEEFRDIKMDKRGRNRNAPVLYGIRAASSMPEGTPEKAQ